MYGAQKGWRGEYACVWGTERVARRIRLCMGRKKEDGEENMPAYGRKKEGCRENTPACRRKKEGRRENTPMYGTQKRAARKIHLCMRRRKKAGEKHEDGWKEKGQGGTAGIVRMGTAGQRKHL